MRRQSSVFGVVCLQFSPALQQSESFGYSSRHRWHSGFCFQRGTLAEFAKELIRKGDFNILLFETDMVVKTICAKSTSRSHNDGSTLSRLLILSLNEHHEERQTRGEGVSRTPAM